MKRAFLIILLILLAGCAIRKVETSKALYQRAREAQDAGEDLEAITRWKALLEQTDREIAEGHYLTSNYFLRASAYFELGEWDRGFEDLKQLQPETLSKNEFWIYPLYVVLMGDYYSKQNMTSVAENFYQSVLKKASFKTSPVYLLALERDTNNSIKRINLLAEKKEDAESFKKKEYESLARDLGKYVEEYPFRSIPHFLMADLLLKTGNSEEALEHFLAALEMGLPTHDLHQSAEFEVASLLSQYEVSPQLKSVLLAKAAVWWGSENSDSIFRAGENSLEWLKQQQGEQQAGPENSTERVR